jgi:hypothetical protein
MALIHLALGTQQLVAVMGLGQVAVLAVVVLVPMHLTRGLELPDKVIVVVRLLALTTRPAAVVGVKALLGMAHKVNLLLTPEVMAVQVYLTLLQALV